MVTANLPLGSTKVWLHINIKQSLIKLWYELYCMLNKTTEKSYPLMMSSELETKMLS